MFVSRSREPGKRFTATWIVRVSRNSHRGAGKGNNASAISGNCCETKIIIKSCCSTKVDHLMFRFIKWWG